MTEQELLWMLLFIPCAPALCIALTVLLAVLVGVGLPLLFGEWKR
jgi:hypothetical protein